MPIHADANISGDNLRVYLWYLSHICKLFPWIFFQIMSTLLLIARMHTAVASHIQKLIVLYSKKLKDKMTKMSEGRSSNHVAIHVGKNISLTVFSKRVDTSLKRS
jgi:hypothetical protein